MLRRDFDAINFKTGINDISLANFRGGKWDFRVIMPNVNLTK
jgi:hypothetical protein